MSNTQSALSPRQLNLATPENESVAMNVMQGTKL